MSLIKSFFIGKKMTEVTRQLMQLSSLLYNVRQEEAYRKSLFQTTHNDVVYVTQCQKSHNLLENFLESVSLLANERDLGESRFWFLDHFEELSDFMTLYKRFRNGNSRFPLWYCELGKFLIVFKLQTVDAGSYEKSKQNMIRNLLPEQHKALFEYESN